jgi:hypothetical protein
MSLFVITSITAGPAGDMSAAQVMYTKLMSILPNITAIILKVCVVVVFAIDGFFL